MCAAAPIFIRPMFLDRKLLAQIHMAAMDGEKRLSMGKKQHSQVHRTAKTMSISSRSLCFTWQSGQ